MDKNKLFSSLFDAYTKAFSEKKKQDCQKEVVEIWNTMKNASNLQLQAELSLKKWNSIALKKIGSLLGLWSKQLNATPKKTKSTENIFANSPTNIQTTQPIPLEFAPDSDQFLEPNSDVEEGSIA